jgi:hypothetical protein
MSNIVQLIEDNLEERHIEVAHATISDVVGDLLDDGLEVHEVVYALLQVATDLGQGYEYFQFLEDALSEVIYFAEEE